MLIVPKVIVDVTQTYTGVMKKAEFIKGIVHLNIIFSYMKVNKICNLDHPVY